MNKRVPFLLLLLFLASKQLLLTGCAGIIPPSGGPKDTIPPHLVTALPVDSATNIKGQKIVLTFDEFVEVKDVSQNVMVSPNPSKSPIIDYNLRKVTVKLRDSLEPNTTYSINFGNSIRDINEGNMYKNFTYVFSTGSRLATGTFKGKVIMAETGKTDSTLLVILHRNLSDTTIYKLEPRYIAKIDGKGAFAFNFIEPGKYNAFVIPNEYGKKYDDSTKVFAFLDSTITIGDATEPATFYAYQEEKKKEKTSNNNNTKNNMEGNKKEDKFLKYATNLEGGRAQDLLSNLSITFSKPLQYFDSSKLVLYDTFYNPLPNAVVKLDTSKSIASLTYKWKEGNYFYLIIPKDAAKDTSGYELKKGDTLSFYTRNESEYGSLKIRFTNLDLTLHPVLELLSSDRIVENVPLTATVFYRKLYKPGDYTVRILLDENRNGVWDAGNYKKRRQPEVVVDKDWKLNVKANWDNETDIKL